MLAAALGLPRPDPGEFVSARLAPLAGGPDSSPADNARFIRLADGSPWPQIRLSPRLPCLGENVTWLPEVMIHYFW